MSVDDSIKIERLKGELQKVKTNRFIKGSQSPPDSSIHRTANRHIAL